MNPVLITWVPAPSRPLAFGWEWNPVTGATEGRYEMPHADLRMAPDFSLERRVKRIRGHLSKGARR